MDAQPIESPLPEPDRALSAPGHIEMIVDAINLALTTEGEHRLFRSGKLAGLFPTRSGRGAESALAALQSGLLETVRTESKGKQVIEWVKATPKGVAFVHEYESPKAVLKELKLLLDTTRAGVPNWMEEARTELATLSTRFETRAAALLLRLDDLAERVEAALRRAETKAPVIAEPVARVVPWALEALEYLDRRRGECPLPELFHAVRERVPELTLSAFQDGLRRLADIRAIRLSHSPEMAEPEYAIVNNGQLSYLVAR